MSFLIESIALVCFLWSLGMVVVEAIGIIAMLVPWMVSSFLSCLLNIDFL